MRSTAFISLSLLLAWPLAVLAEGPASGCWARNYDAEHLAAHPEQVAAWLSLAILGKNEAGETEARLRIALANQGRAATEGMGGQILDQHLICGDWGHGPACGVECDGGQASVAEGPGGTLVLTTGRLLVGGEGCEGEFDIVERLGEPVTYRLERAAPGDCEGD